MLFVVVHSVSRSSVVFHVVMRPKIPTTGNIIGDNSTLRSGKRRKTLHRDERRVNYVSLQLIALQYFEAS